MIEDLDSAERTPSRRLRAHVVWAALAAMALVGYEAASSPVFQGPFATPNPLALPAPKVRILNSPAAYVRTWCAVPMAPVTVNAFVGDHPVTIVRMPAPPANPCSPLQIGLPIAFERVAP